MTDDVDYWSATVQAFAPLQLPSPELTEKLLKRPPFRFIHDLVSAINARFAAYDHVIPDTMKDGKSIDDKETKVAYLTILIDYVGSLFNTKLDVSAKKIVSGHEAAKTNVFLQYLAAGVGLAQQDKAKKEAEKASTAATEAPPPPPPVEAEPEWKAPPANPADYGLADLPHRDSLPRKKSSSASEPTERTQVKTEAINASKRFEAKLATYSINLDSEKKETMAERGVSIAQIWKDLQEPKVDTTESKLSADALEMAVQRQLDQLKQLKALLEENGAVVDSLESLLV